MPTQIHTQSLFTLSTTPEMAVPRWVVVDDTDPTIQYIGASWFQVQRSEDNIGSLGPAYQSTLHGTETNASFSFAFNGNFCGRVSHRYNAQQQNPL